MVSAGVRFDALALRVHRDAVNRAGSIVIDDGEFRAERVEDAQALVRSVARNIKLSRDTRPDAVRLVDASGRE